MGHKLAAAGKAVLHNLGRAAQAIQVPEAAVCQAMEEAAEPRPLRVEVVGQVAAPAEQAAPRPLRAEEVDQTAEQAAPRPLRAEEVDQVAGPAGLHLLLVEELAATAEAVPRRRTLEPLRPTRARL